MSNGDSLVTVIKECARRTCGHDRSNHYWDDLGSGDCLAKGCTCQCFVDVHGKEEKRDTLPSPPPDGQPEPFPKAFW